MVSEHLIVLHKEFLLQRQNKVSRQLETGLHVMRDCAFARAVWDRWGDRGLLTGNFFFSSCYEWLSWNCLQDAKVMGDVSWNCYFLSTLWGLWNNRNNLIFKGRNEMAGAVWVRAKKLAEEITVAVTFNQVTTQRGQRWVQWQKPDAGMYKLNTDGAMKHATEKASTSGLIRDDRGRWIKGFVFNVGQTTSVLAELWGVREGLALAKSLSINALIVELDAAIVVKFLKEGIGVTHPCYTIVEDCIGLMQGNWIVEVRHVLREGNQCADKLAHIAQDYPPGITMLNEAPTELDEFLLRDALGSVTLRS